MQHLAPPADIGSRIFIGRRPREASLGHQEIRGDILDPHHTETILFQNATDSGKQMIVPSPERSPNTANDMKRIPVEANFG